MTDKTTAPDSPKPSGTTVTHASIRERITGSLTVSGDIAGCKLFAQYVTEQEAAEKGARAGTSTLSDIIDHWKKRAETAEREVASLRGQLDACETELRIVKESRDAAGQDVVKLRAQLAACPVCAETTGEHQDYVRGLVEQARQEGYERGKAEARNARVVLNPQPHSHHPTCRCELCERRDHDL